MAEQMKPSGIDWIGDIPESWSIKRIKYCTDIIMGQSPDSNLIKEDNGIYPFMQGNAEFTNLYPKPSLYCDFPNKVSRVGDILMSVRAPVGELNISDREYGIGRGLCSIRPAYFNTKYFWYFMLKSKGDFSVFSNGSTFEAITTENLLNFPCVVPGIQEQQAIADFLDKECAQIDSVAADLEKQIALLQQYKKSLITETVTKGLDKSVPMKDSGVEWIGEIPTHWDKKRMKYFLSVSSGEAITSDQLEDGEYPVYGGGKQMGYFNKTNVDKNQILIGRVGANCGCVTITHTPSWATDNALVVQTLCYFKYIYYILISADLNRLNEANAQPLITGAKVGNCVVPFTANYTEQKQIAQYLDERCEKIEGLIIGKQKQLETIIQHKKSLIYEYVTGKKRVKEVQ